MKAVRREISDTLGRALALCRAGDWDGGLYHLGQLTEAGPMPGLFYSYLGYGIARCQGKIKEGLKLCQHSIKVEFYEAENYLNLARTYMLDQDRSGAVQAIRKGLKVDPQNLELLALYRDLGIRSEPVLPFLSRQNIFNQILGRIRSLFR
jgi:tetratricopeptide (TPR) repeat protein